MTQASRAFLDAYLECALWSSTERDDDGTPLADNYGVSDIAPESLASATEQCNAFVESAGELLADIDDSQAGHDFWLTRNHHGAGFWDRDLGEVGDKLTKLAHGYGSCDPYVGDDKLVYFS